MEALVMENPRRKRGRHSRSGYMALCKKYGPRKASHLWRNMPYGKKSKHRKYSHRRKHSLSLNAPYLGVGSLPEKVHAYSRHKRHSRKHRSLMSNPRMGFLSGLMRSSGRHTRRHYRSNPLSFKGIFNPVIDSFKPKTIVQDLFLVAGAGGSVVATKTILNIIKKPEWDKGYVGAGANLVTSALLSAGVSLLLKRNDWAEKVFEGGKLVTYLRVLKAALPEGWADKAGLNLSGVSEDEKKKIVAYTARYIAERLKQKGVNVPGYTSGVNDYLVTNPITGQSRISDYLLPTGRLSGMGDPGSNPWDNRAWDATMEDELEYTV